MLRFQHEPRGRGRTLHKGPYATAREADQIHGPQLRPMWLRADFASRADASGWLSRELVHIGGQPRSGSQEIVKVARVPAPFKHLLPAVYHLVVVVYIDTRLLSLYFKL